MEVCDIGKIIFGISSAEDIKKTAVCKIDSSKLSGPGTVYDEKMGCAADTNEKCVTCKLTKECWGHFGYIELNEPVMHPMYYKTIAIFLKCFCKKCYRLLLSEKQLTIAGIVKLKNERKFLRIVEELERKEMCAHCSAPRPKIIYKSKDMTISMEYKQKKSDGGKLNIILTVEDIKKIFDNVTEDDVRLIGFDPERIHPKDFIITCLPVIPPCSRPYVVVDGTICDDDITYQLIEIVKINNNLAGKNLDEQKKQKLINGLKFRIQTMMNNSKGRAKQPTDNRPLKGYKERLTGKGGRLRSNIMGKRVDYSARTVIDPDPNLKTHELAIPYEIAQIHTKPEVVTEFNIKWLTDIVHSGKANFVTTIKPKKDNEKEGAKIRINLQYAMFQKGTELIIDDIIVRNADDFKFESDTFESDRILDLMKKYPKVSFIPVITGNEKMNPNDRIIRNKKFLNIKAPVKKDIVLKIGDIVERQLIRGDVVLFNRQPTLHKGSMLAMEVIPMPFKSFRFNLAIAKSFNSDFDGDEMNIHAPQSHEAEAELRLLTDVRLNIITAQESKPIITITQDSLVSSFLMTRRKFDLTKEQFQNLCMKADGGNKGDVWDIQRIEEIKRILKKFGKIDPETKEPNIYNGRGLFSLIFPRDFNYEYENNAHPDEPKVKIYCGVFLEGAFDKSVLGSNHDSIIQIMNKEYGAFETCRFIDNTQFIANAWLTIHSFSIGLDDCMITSEKSVLAIKNTLTQCYTKAQGIEESTQNEGIREVRVTGALSQAKDIGMKIAKDSMNPKNNFLVTVGSGAKGDYFNIAQLTGLLGQQNLEGKRVTPVLNHGKRTLPHYPFGELTKEREYESRGFVRHSFIRGLNPEEFFFHAMSGREGVCDKQKFQLCHKEGAACFTPARYKQYYSLVSLICKKIKFGEIPHNVGKYLKL